ncbi:MAG: polyribonucleotide nucleotidyltransferase [Saprospiraceae bacterium]|jgi:polyribonucleotide nucleotidyltransferase|nr:polyribonucleotide nucleotidyltransferase [Saprospiraceae bacterium]MBP9208894.1 polyribonucleotide nucleotidyltransferase [Saprospiraceae bacterium]MBV6472078.1 Polyribonucleotide nucleotidyltransferase [Saprospiraceae bacterium]
MGLKTPFSTTFNLPDGREVTLETGKLGTQAHGSAVVRMGKTMLFASVVSSEEKREGLSFFPLSVDYQERFASFGKIPGNFFRREAKLSDYEVLICRLVDRAIRPLFDESYRYETQIIINLISGDGETMPDALAGLAASTALACSNIPWQGPMSEVRVAKIDGAFVVNPERTALANAEVDLIIAATFDNLMMVEGEGRECDEADLIEAIRIGHDAIKVQIQAQLALAAQLGEAVANKREVPAVEIDQELQTGLEVFASARVNEISGMALNKTERKKAFDKVLADFIERIEQEKGEEYLEENTGKIKDYFDKLKKKLVRAFMLETGKRLDGRSGREIRPIWTEIEYLPAAHGSAIFNRGETQSLTSVTLGTKDDELLIDNALEYYNEKFILHYNFPGFSVGEVKPQRGPGRREVGHANLAARSIRKVLSKEFPYTIRVVSDILESNGSSSMATVCATSLALMDAGVPVKAAVSGIAMGLISEGGKTIVLSDILGDEDALGDMDFKITGTRKGICGTQMDMKIDGLSYELLESALMQAKEGRLHILDRMAESIEVSNPDLKPHAPRIVEMVIEKSFIGGVIGPGGKVIQEMQAKTGTKINIEEVGDKGIINIFGPDKTGLDAAVAMIEAITFVPQVGDVYDGKVVSIFPFGVFVDFRNKSGLLHVSEISHSRIDNVEDVFKVGDPVTVKLIGLDPKTGKLRLSRKALMSKKEQS